MANSRPVVAWMRQETIERIDKAVADDPASFRSRSHFIDAAVSSALDSIGAKHKGIKRDELGYLPGERPKHRRVSKRITA